MLNSQRIFVDAISRYCARHGITVEVRANGWLIVMQKGPQRRLAFGYDIGLNSAVARAIANDKAATADVLALAGIPCVPHTLFLNPNLYQYTPSTGSWEAMLDLLERHPAGIVVKPNEGTSGRSVFLVTSRPKLELAVQEIFASHTGLAISPYVNIEDEVRVVLLDEAPLVVYRKSRPAVVGDGKHSLLELALAATPAEQRATVLPGLVRDRDKAELDAIVPAGQIRVLNWRHNLDGGSRPALLEQGDRKESCVQLAVRAANAIGLRFGSIDVIRTDGGLEVLEINSGVMMEVLGRLHPDLVQGAYEAALDKVFGSDTQHSRRPGEGRDP
jgi:glutathione synthase/RimK-type ligase-like ATP-grasp enzyme